MKDEKGGRNGPSLRVLAGDQVKRSRLGKTEPVGSPKPIQRDPPDAGTLGGENDL